MDMEAQVREALAAEIKRQAANPECGLKVEDAGEGRLRLEGRLDLEAVAMAVVGSVAGGP